MHTDEVACLVADCISVYNIILRLQNIHMMDLPPSYNMKSKMKKKRKYSGKCILDQKG